MILLQIIWQNILSGPHVRTLQQSLLFPPFYPLWHMFICNARIISNSNDRFFSFQDNFLVYIPVVVMITSHDKTMPNCIHIHEMSQYYYFSKSWITYLVWVYLEGNDAVSIRKGWMPSFMAVAQLLYSQPMNFSAHLHMYTSPIGWKFWNYDFTFDSFISYSQQFYLIYHYKLQLLPLSSMTK